MSVVYRAKDLVLERHVALKILKRNLSDDQVFRNKFKSEAKASAKLSHPNIVTTYDFGLDSQQRLFIVMELVVGSHLKDKIRNKNISSIYEGFLLLKQASSGLSYAHQQGIVHCDIKPQNMLVSEGGVLKITDFGISRALETISRTENYSEIWGSPYYISPEQAGGKPPSPASDVYSLGIILYEVFTGKLPFTDNDVLSLLEKHQKEKLIPPRKINPSIPYYLEKIIIKALEKDPKNRFANGSEIYKALNSISTDITKLNSINSGVINESNQLKRSIISKSPNEKSTMVNWPTIILGFLALIMIGGLIPFWLFVYYSLNR
ncbi:MAG: serine/threonine protein kinase [Anaerolineaceae bacterium]|nr:serine/threonine protein kinase [Anaerolineaceae bacterium]